MNVLSFNLGSSSLKYAVHSVAGVAATQLHAGTTTVEDRPSAAAGAAQCAIDRVTAMGIVIDAVGHRIVFGGEDDAPSPVTPALIERLEALAVLDPLHIPGSLAVIEQASKVLECPAHVACFDTAFFHDIPQTAKALPIFTKGDPLLRRYGFHGLSYESVVDNLGSRLMPRTIVAHLGSGCSLAALSNGRPIDMTMGFSPIGGIVMATRPGDLDPGVLLYLLERGVYDAASLREMLERNSGLRALSGGESDIQRLGANGDKHSAFAVEMFERSVAKAVGALTVTLGGIDLLVFTGGIGEHNLAVRERICAQTRVINSGFEVCVVAADENLMIARHTARVAARSRGQYATPPA